MISKLEFTWGKHNRQRRLATVPGQAKKTRHASVKGLHIYFKDKCVFEWQAWALHKILAKKKKPPPPTSFVLECAENEVTTFTPLMHTYRYVHVPKFQTTRQLGPYGNEVMRCILVHQCYTGSASKGVVKREARHYLPHINSVLPYFMQSPSTADSKDGARVQRKEPTEDLSKTLFPDKQC